MNTPLVSICCITYNHAPFIRKCLDGFLMQKSPTGVSADELWYEILIHDDCSTDGTTEIIKKYAAKYPNLIFPLYEEENQYSQGKGNAIDMYNYTRARGLYVAYCEGDDYWTDPYKLCKQVDFMESHLDYSICLHGCSVLDLRLGTMSRSHEFEDYENAKKGKSSQGIDVTPEDYFNGYWGQPLSMVFRLSMFDFNWCNKYKYYRDTHELYHLLKAGKGYWMNFDGGVYVKHDKGISAGITKERQCQVSYEIASELYYNSPDVYTQRYYASTLKWLISSRASIPGVSLLTLVWKHFYMTRSIKQLVKDFILICKRS